jgi:hypothetical protein
MFRGFLLKVASFTQGRVCESEAKTPGVREADVIDHIEQEYPQCNRASRDCRGLEKDESWGPGFVGIVRRTAEKISGKSAEVG